MGHGGQHRHPEREWRVETLAREVGMSRSGFSARFSALVGESVLQYLTDLRMRLAHRELLHSDDIPMKVAINEAIELGKRYSTEASGAFVNGILDRIRKDRGL